MSTYFACKNCTKQFISNATLRKHVGKFHRGAVLPEIGRSEKTQTVMTTGVRNETGWQSDKSLAECMRHMLDNEIGTDVCFEVGPPDGDIVTIRAHKYMLISRSPVFEGMFSSGMAECRDGTEAKVRVEDIDSAVFKEFLTYVYCESVSLCSESALPLMYAATKYLVPKLARLCGECLSKDLNVKNVLYLLEQSLIYNDEQLRRDCLKLISANQKAVLAGREILSSSRQIMEAIFDTEYVALSELLLYETAVKWAKHQLKNSLPGKKPKTPNDVQIREMLGGLLYKIRFPVMKPNEFGELMLRSSLLTAEEKESVYYFLVTKKKDRQLKFPTEWRKSEEVWIDRTLNCLDHNRWYSDVDAINFTTDRDILLTGVGLYKGLGGRAYDVEMEILQSTYSQFKKKVTVESAGISNTCKISLDAPIFIPAGVLHSIRNKTGAYIGHYGQSCQAVCTKETVTVAFSRNTESPTTNEHSGQIPRLYFRCL